MEYPHSNKAYHIHAYKHVQTTYLDIVLKMFQIFLNIICQHLYGFNYGYNSGGLTL